MEENKSTEPLASEIYQDLKCTIKFLKTLVVVLVAALIFTNLYHNWKWSQFETVAVDSRDGGNATYVGGDNTGGVYNGESGSTPQEKGEGPWSAG